MTYYRTDAQELSNDRLYDAAPSIFATEPYEGVSDRYTFVPTIQVVDYLRDSGWAPVYASENRVIDQEKQGFQKHMIRFVRKDQLGVQLSENRTQTGLRIYNSHDLSNAYHGVGDIVRKVCSNGMIASDHTASFRAKHMGFTPELFIGMAAKLADKLTLMQQKADEWRTIEMSPDEQGVFAVMANNIAFDGKSNIEPTQLLQPRRYNDGRRNDLWVTFNKIQENIMRGGLNAGRTKTGRRRTTREITALDREKKVNQSLWALSETVERIVKKAA